MNSNSIFPLVFAVIGATGTGKTNLSIQIASLAEQHFNLVPSIISADSMQIYRDINILTTKASFEDRQAFQHHLVDIVDVSDDSFSVCEYQSIATRLLRPFRCLDANEKPCTKTRDLPILVGGTHYYIESCLWPDKFCFEKLKTPPLSETQKAEFESLSNEQLHQRLRDVDPKRAELLHPNDRRRVYRSLEIFYAINATHSSFLDRVRSMPINYPVFFLWPHTNFHTLDKMTDQRIDKMIAAGLEEELKYIAKTFQHKQMNYQCGILQAIGVKEFAPWIRNFQLHKVSDKQLFDTGITLLKLHTRQYARSQVAWIQDTLLKLPGVVVFPLYFDSEKNWESDVADTGKKIVLSILDQANHGMNFEQIIQSLATNGKLAAIRSLPPKNRRWIKYYCEYCLKVLNGRAERGRHIKSRKHKAKSNSVRKAMAKTAVKRLLLELGDIQNDLNEDVYLVCPSENCLYEWKACIRGPSDTPYENTYFDLDITIPQDYPLRPPAVVFATKIFHPNIHYKTGEICLDLLKEAWSAVYRLQSVCMAIITLLAHPEPDFPLNCDCGNLLRCGDFRGYNSMARMYSQIHGSTSPTITRFKNESS